VYSVYQKGRISGNPNTAARINGGLENRLSAAHATSSNGDRMETLRAGYSEIVFLRAASGLSRWFGGWDVFIYNLGLICIGMNVAYTQRFGPGFYPNCSIVGATILAGLLAGAVALGFWAWTSSVPRSGGIYVYLTRAGLPALGFAISFAECIAWLYYLGITATMIGLMGVVPLAVSLFGIESPIVHHVAEPSGQFIVASIAIWIAAWILCRGTETFLRWQRIAMVVAIVGTIALLYVLHGDPAIFHKNFNAEYASFGVDPYQTVISHAKANGWFGTRPGSMKRTMALMVWPFLALIGGVCSMAFGGEVRRNAKDQFWGMMGSVTFAVLVFIVIAVLAGHSLGNAFQGAIAYNQDNDDPVKGPFFSTPVQPYLGYFACLATNSMALRVLVCLGFMCWPWFWAPGLLMYASRAFFAWSLDRAAPKALAKLHPTRGTPYVAILAAAAISQVLLALMLWTPVGSLVFILLIIGAWTATQALGVIFPITTPEIFEEGSLCNKHFLGMPLMSVLCAAGTAAMILSGYLLWRDPVAAGHAEPSLRGMALILIVGLIIHLAMRIYRRRQGIDITLGYEEIPVE
jgi:APA family basic amino acid/polyamine antiporter